MRIKRFKYFQKCKYHELRTNNSFKHFYCLRWKQFILLVNVYIWHGPNNRALIAEVICTGFYYVESGAGCDYTV